MITPIVNRLSAKAFAALAWTAILVVCAAWIGADLALSKAAVQTPTIGERLTYSVSYEGFDNVGYLQLYTVSRGKLSGKDAVEYRARAKTYNMLGAAFLTVDESRQTFASTETGYPLYSLRTQNTSLEPRETTSNYTAAPATSYDLLTLLSKAREAGGSGSFEFTENEKSYTAVFTPGENQRIKTPAGEFDTTYVNVESSFLADNNITELGINFSTDDHRIPVLIRFKVRKGVFKVTLSGRDIVEVPVDVTPTPATTVTATPFAVRTPRPQPTATPYFDNQPLSPDLPFSLGESLEYNLSSGGRSIGRLNLAAKERKMFEGQDSLLLTAKVMNLVPGTNVIGLRDSVSAQVDPDSLTPLQFDSHLSGGLAPFTQSVKFDQDSGKATFGGKTADVPIGTHSLLSFFYAIRTMNLKPSKDLNNPVNDTRVAVFWSDKAYIFTLRPSKAEIEDLNGKKISCLLVAISTGNQQLDQLSIKVWLSDDGRRLPLRISFGSYQADLVQP
jgi:Protein of unknown function (DUF3108)